MLRSIVLNGRVPRQALRWIVPLEGARSLVANAWSPSLVEMMEVPTGFLRIVHAQHSYISCELISQFLVQAGTFMGNGEGKVLSSL